MTLNELLKNVSMLTLGEYPDVSAPFIAAVNRAVRSAFSDFSPSATARVFAGGRRPDLKIQRLVFEGEGDIALPLTGRAFSMRIYGQGSYILTEGGVSVRTDFNSGGKTFSALIPSGSATLTLTGENPFTVLDLVTFRGVRGGVEEAIPDGKEEFCLDLKSVVSDFLSFRGPITTPDGAILDTAKLDGSTVTLTLDHDGEICVSYNRLPERISPDTRGELSIPEELLEPICTLAAALLVTEDSPELSARLFKMYERDVEATKRAYRQEGKATVVSDGWA